MKKYKFRKVITISIYVLFCLGFGALPLYLHALEPYYLDKNMNEVSMGLLWGPYGYVSIFIFFVLFTAVYGTTAAVYVAAAYPESKED